MTSSVSSMKTQIYVLAVPKSFLLEKIKSKAEATIFEEQASIQGQAMASSLSSLNPRPDGFLRPRAHWSSLDSYALRCKSRGTWTAHRTSGTLPVWLMDNYFGHQVANEQTLCWNGIKTIEALAEVPLECGFRVKSLLPPREQLSKCGPWDLFRGSVRSALLLFS